MSTVKEIKDQLRRRITVHKDRFGHKPVYLQVDKHDYLTLMSDEPIVVTPIEDAGKFPYTFEGVILSSV